MIELVDLKAQYLASKAAIDRRMQTVLEHGQFIMGPEVAELEQRLAAITGARHCVTVSSGTDALLIALMALGVGAGDEVITSPFSFVAPAEAIVRLGATPVFCDIERDTCLLDAGLLEGLITPRTRAVLPVSLYGQPCDMDAIDAVAARHGLVVVEDAAQSFGATYRGRPSCHLSTIGCTSFFPTKPLGCFGDGGALFTDDDALAQAARQIRVHGQSARYRHTRVGMNGRMDTLQCAVLLGKLERLTWELERRRAVAERYDEALAGLGVARVLTRPERASVFAQYTVFLENRDAVAAALAEAGVATAIHYPTTLAEQPAYAQLTNDDLAGARHVASRVLSLPLHPYLEPSLQDQVVEALARALG
jgi:UDP-2-acetamido-2-deoxy-ribo-hexuluronate aminotransferase